MSQPSIRKYRHKDLEAVLKVFSEENQKAHSFLPETILVKAQHGLSTLLQNPQEKAWVVEMEGQILGFIATKAEQSYIKIAALFMTSQYQSKGLGRRLINKARSVMKKALELAVYKENSRAVTFYEKRCGFSIQQSGEENGHEYWIMKLKN
jgi:predicted acetyltransferase